MPRVQDTTLELEIWNASSLRYILIDGFISHGYLLSQLLTARINSLRPIAQKGLLVS